MKKFFFLFILNFFQNTVYSQQNKTDSLLAILNTAKEDSVKVNVLNDLFLEYEFSDAEKAKDFLNKAFLMSQKINYNSGIATTYTHLGYLAEDNGDNQEALKNYFASLKINEAIKNAKGVSKAYNCIGIIYYNTGNYPEALKNYFASLKIKVEIGDKRGMAATYINIGNVYAYQGDFQGALINYLSALKINEEVSDKSGVAATLNSIGNIYLDQGNYPGALKNYFASLKINEETGNKKGIAYAYNNIGIVYKNQGNYPEALKNYLACLSIYESLNNRAGLATVYNNIGIVYKNQGNYTESLKNQFACLKIKEALGDKIGIANSYENIGGVYFSQGNYPDALKNFYASLKFREEVNSSAGIAGSYTNIGNVFLKQKKHKDAEEYFLKAKKLSEKIGIKEHLKTIYYSLSELDSAKGDFKGAYINTKLYFLYRDSLDNEETRKKTIQSQMTYDFEKKEAITKLEQEKKEVAHVAHTNQQRLVIYSILAGLLMVIIFAVFLYKRFRVTQKQKSIIELQKQEVEHQKSLVDEKNQEISSSINYAKRIQTSFLTSETFIKKHLSEYFILYKPRDIVSGDFYWMYKEGDYFYFCIADCTGHGIPGAFMSLIGMGILNETVFSKKMSETSHILNELRRIIILALNPEGSDMEGKDGMDLVLGRLHMKSKVLQYSSANNSFYIARNGELIECKPDKMPVGSFGEFEKPFSQKNIQLTENDTIYAITDGFADQFGGEKGKKFKYKQLETILLSNVNKPMHIQSEILNARFNEWKRDLEQVDDVTVIGIRI